MFVLLLDKATVRIGMKFCAKLVQGSINLPETYILLNYRVRNVKEEEKIYVFLMNSEQSSRMPANTFFAVSILNEMKSIKKN